MDRKNAIDLIEKWIFDNNTKIDLNLSETLTNYFEGQNVGFKLSLDIVKHLNI